MKFKYILTIIFLCFIVGVLSLLAASNKEYMLVMDNDPGEQPILNPTHIDYLGLKFHAEEAHKEKGLDHSDISPSLPVAKFAHKYCDDVSNRAMPFSNKKRDFCFIGNIDSYKPRRLWVCEFAKSHFTSNSVFVHTSSDENWESLGDFDKSHEKLGFVAYLVQTREAQYREIHENEFYFKTMCESKFILCPAGDAPWSFRFYETIMCKSIPIVETVHHTYRTQEEKDFDYIYLLANDYDKINEVMNNESLYNEMVDKNTELFRKHHMLS
uniref:Exostosin GT47 domain-containing protein n=1 Tax=viral metagenome TaxID=1070528 RepID=A0A6C0B4D4_9ZZZZ